ncbi:hypothetical protein Tco_0462003 [Tanacetum coccineum]
MIKSKTRDDQVVKMIKPLDDQVGTTPTTTTPPTTEAPTTLIAKTDPSLTVLQRLSTLEKKVEKLSKVDHSEVIEESVQANGVENMKNALISIIKSIRQEMKDGIMKRQVETSTTNDEVSSIAINKEETPPCQLPKELSQDVSSVLHINNHNLYVFATLDSEGFWIATKRGRSFICITDREDEALPLGRVNGARFKAMIRKIRANVGNANHAGCQDTRRSTSDSMQLLDDRLVSWSSKKQKSTTISITKAEYIALSRCCAKIL